QQEVAADEFFASHPRRRLEGQLVTGVSVAADGAGRGGAFLKLARSKVDLAIVSAAAWVRVEQGKVAEARVALGALRGLPERVSEVEQALAGAEAGDPTLAGRLAELTSRVVRPAHDLRVSRAYRCHVAGVILGRAVARALRRALAG
ncbi:MAG: xanthine dehydrogenase family protein subunit M, partial [Deltaproteobacteria bacterium]|nr:xanthine dehydrogenase family protein subunit M [Deltaproteobacteria bacterium]